MIILKMRASFGKLNGELTLHEGLNLLCLPNEAGKSTWAAFLRAMLYGIDTREKASAANQYLPDKERYKPWDGRPMEGILEILWHGRHITIERKTHGRIPMGVFAAYDSISGTPITELTADNCGKVLCGVEEAVFERTAFIRQLGLPVSEDAALEKRLSALVTTGEEGCSASEVDQKLHEMSVKLSRSGTGRISRLSALISKTEQELSEIQLLQDEAMLLRAQVDQAQHEYDRLDALCKRIEKAQSAKKYLALEELAQKNATQELLCRKLQAQADKLPDENTLHELGRKLDQVGSALQTAQMESAFAPEAPKAPQPPSCFSGMSLQQAEQKQAADAEQYERLSSAKQPKATAIWLCALIFSLCAGLCFFNLYLGLAAAAGALIAVFAALGVYLRRNNQAKNSRLQAELILTRYGVAHMEETEQLLSVFRAQMQSFDNDLQQHENESKERAERLSSAKQNLETLMQQIRSFAPSCADAARAKEAIHAALQVHLQLHSEMRTLELQRTQLASMRGLLGDVTQHAPDAQALSLDAAKITYERSAAAERLSHLTSRLAEQNGKLCASADASMLQAQLEQYRTQRTQDEELQSIITLASAALNRADETLRSRFSPQITAQAGAILAALTEEKYTNLLLKSDMSLSVREPDGILMRPSACMSCGTADQMYLALRLAMVRRLLPENTPVLLDDALVNFDDKRTENAIKLLSDEAKNRQIILFTCKEISNVL